MVRQLLSAEQTARQITPSVVYVSRNDSVSRRVSNEDSLLEALQIDGRTRGYGLVVVNCEPNSTWCRQENNDPSQVFAAANVVLGPHGSGLANIIFCKHGTAVIEITLQDTMLFYTHMSAALGLRHLSVGAERIGRAAGDLRGDLAVNITNMMQLVRGVLS